MPDGPELLVVEPPAPIGPAVIPDDGALTLRDLAGVITFERATYAALLLAALFVRVVALDARPLAPAEAQTASAAYQFLTGTLPSAYTSPLLFTLDWLSFFQFGAFDLTARLLPALFSSALIFLPALMRGVLGRTGALIAALLIALSPALVLAARSLSGADLASGAALAALVLFWSYRDRGSVGSLYASAVLAALALTADQVAFTILAAGALFILFEYALKRPTANVESAAASSPDSLDGARVLFASPPGRAIVLFVLVYLMSATTFLLNRDGLGVALNLFGSWLGAFAPPGFYVRVPATLLAYEPLALIFGLAGVVLSLTARGESASGLSQLRLVSVVALLSLAVALVTTTESRFTVAAVILPLLLVSGWFVGNLLERAREDIRSTGGWSTMTTGELPILLMLLILAALVYLQVVTFLQQTHFTPAVDALYRLLAGNTAETSMAAAALAIVIIAGLLFAVFAGLSVLLIGAARTTSLIALFVLFLLGLGMARGVGLVTAGGEPLRELLAPQASPEQVRDLVGDLEWISQWRFGDGHVIRIAADPGLGAVGRWYLRDFGNVTWTREPDRFPDAQAVLSPASTPPPGNWMGQRYHTAVTWDPANMSGLDLWKWFVFRQGGTTTYQTTLLWLPTLNP